MLYLTYLRVSHICPAIFVLNSSIHYIWEHTPTLTTARPVGLDYRITVKTNGIDTVDQARYREGRG